MHTLLPVPGEVIWIRQRRWRVRRASRHRNVVRLDVASRDEQLTFLAPFDRPGLVSPSDRPQRVRPQSAFARLASLMSRAHGARTVLSAVSADVALLPYQLEPALAMIDGARRVLIADEVGLGKTIQAGLVIAELLRRRGICRILVLVPATLSTQWHEELRRRFKVDGCLADRDRLSELARAGARDENPWRRTGVWIASLDYVKQPHVLPSVLGRPWDLVVFDEAHGACGDSERHAAAHALAGRARRLLLLTATPHDGDARRFSRLMDLGQLDDAIVVFRRTRGAMTTLTAARRVRWHRVAVSPQERRVLDRLSEYEGVVLNAAGTDRRSAALLLLSVFRKRALSTMSALTISLERRLAWLESSSAASPPDWQQASLDFDDAPMSDEIGDADRAALAADIGLNPRQERTWLKRLIALTLAARPHERKIARLIALLVRRREPAVVFTEFRHSLEALSRRLQPARTLAILHGGQTDAERSRQLDEFTSGAASVLLATDVASLGLNLQHRCRWAISLELPWNPARLEQRVGRLDRIGQTRPVHFTLLVASHAAEHSVLRRLAQRTLTARRSLGDDVLGGIEPSDSAIREHVLTRAGEGPPSASRGICVPLCGRWARPARHVAIGLARRREWAARWKVAHVDHGRPRQAVAPRWPPMYVFHVPIVDATGAFLEEHVVALRVPAASGAVLTNAAAIDAARRHAVRRLEPRARRLERWLDTRHQSEIATEQAIAAAIEFMTRPGEVQPGLFDRAALRAFETARADVAEGQAEHAAAVMDRDAPASVSVGRPRLALIFDCQAGGAKGNA